MRFSYGSWFLLFHYSVTLWDNDTFIWIYSSYTVKEKLQRKRNAFPLKQWQCVISLASIYTTRFLSEQLLVIEPIHIWHMQIILHSPDFAGDKKVLPLIHQFFRSHVAALVRCVLIGGEYISLIKSCQIRRRFECVRLKRHWVTEWK